MLFSIFTPLINKSFAVIDNELESNSLYYYFFQLENEALKRELAEKSDRLIDLK